MIGFLLHTHVLRTEIKGDLTFRELVARVQQGALNLYEHRSVPFDHVVRALQPERSLSYSPLFQVMVNWRDRDQNLCFIGMEGLDIESVLVDSKISKFDLTLFLTDMGEEVWAEMEYSTDLFDAARIERMFGHYQTLLEAVAADPDQRLSELSLLPEAERRQLLEQWNNTKVDYPASTSIHEPFEAQAARTPDRVALVFERQTLSYGELNRRANQLAHHLRGLGVGPNVLVGLCVKRSLDMAVGLLGILKAGAAYVPMDSAYPTERLQYILEDSKASVVLTQESLVDGLPSFAGQLICLDKDWAKIAHESEKNPPPQANPENVAYVLFTSGSSGKPKGVEISHRAVVNFLNSMREVPGMTAQDTLLSVTTLSFDIFGLEIWLPLTSGAKVVIASEDVARDGKELAVLMRRSGATVMQATPSTWRLLLEAAWEGNPHLKILCGGEAWPDELAEQLLPKCSTLWNMYGPTETTIWSSVHQVRAGTPVSIGHPIANTEFYVVDSHLQPVPVGVPGELLIGGAGLAHGYLNRPELTAEKFIADRFRTDTGSRLYRTGDLVRYREDGTLEFLQRIDQQVKIRGFRIELGEIESVLRSHPRVREAVVVMREEREKQLVAYVVPAEEPSCTTAELRDYLKQRLPAYMVPAAFSALENVPLTPNGKVDRKVLSGKGYAAAEGSSGYRLASDWTLTMLEAQLLQIWQEVLGARYMGLRDSFFDLGGHSLLVLKMIDQVNNLFGVSLSVPAFFLNPTIESIARILEQENKIKPVPKLVPLQGGRTEGTIFFFDASLGLCRLAELLRAGPASFALSSMLPQSILEVAKGYRTTRSIRLEDMAAPLVELIEAERRSDPCVLVGYCWGGNLAFEVAHQLERDGVEVDLIVLVDSWQTTPNFWQRLKLRSRADVAPAVEWRLRYLWETAKRLGGRGQRYSEPIEARGPSVIKTFQTVRDYYQFRPLNAHGLLIRARDDRYSQISVAEGTHGWGKFFKGGLEVVDVPGDHVSMLSDSNISNISDVIKTYLPQLANLA
jgi:amino acid adenylation domain-containing protein